MEPTQHGTLALPNTSLVGSVLALLGASCCVLPMAFVLLGLGGSWLAVFAPIAGLSPYLLGIAAAFVLAAWISARFQLGAPRVRWTMGASTIAAILAHAVYLYRDPLTDLLVGAV